MIKSIFGEEYDIEEESVDKVKDIVKKAKAVNTAEASVEKQLKSNKLSLEDRLRLIRDQVYEVLKKQKNNVSVITTREALHNYISGAIAFGKIAIDTETNNSLDPLTCKLMGPCFYYPGDKQVYVPINHVNIHTNERLTDQLTEQDIKEELQRLVEAKTFIIMHNGKFDYQVIKCTCDVVLPIDFDTMIAAKLINENEPASLKEQYHLHIDPEQEKYSITHLFRNIKYEQVDPKLFALYAATDAYDTYKLYEWQLKILESVEYVRVYKLFNEVEIPCIPVVAEMELNGVCFDTAYADRLKVKYEKILAEIDEKINKELENNQDKILAWRLSPEANEKVGKKTKAEQLETPINLASPAQLAILLYDILKIGIIDKDSPRGTGEEVLSKVNLPICKLLLERRGVVKLLDAFILSLPKEVNPKTGRIHCNFNQYGAATGRFSSSEPNLQQIPSHEKSIRMLFRAAPGKVLIGSDFSQQEPRLLSFFSRDENMINAYRQGKDLYATIAMGVYNLPYWDCMEHTEDGGPNPEGKKRRQSVKAILLGIMYGRGAAAIAEQIHGTIEEAQKIVDDFYKSFPKVKTWMDKLQTNLKATNYVEDFYGRRRRLFEINLPPYEVKYLDEAKIETKNFNPFLCCLNKKQDDTKIQYYQKACIGLRSNKEYSKLRDQAKGDGINIIANTGKIAQAERQCVNAAIQGSAATMTKIAMNKIYRDPELNKYGFKLLIGVHDELIGEVDKDYTQQAADRLTYIMKTCVEDIVDVPFKCDADICEAWYTNDYHDVVLEEYEDLVKSGYTRQDAKREIYKRHIEQTPEFLDELIFKNVY